MIFPSREIATLTLAMTIARTALRLWQPPKRCHCEEQQRLRRGNPLNRNENSVAIANDRICSRNY